MKALSIKQPWANMIASGQKTIETRFWRTPVRGDIVICSSRTPRIYPAGYALAVAELVECRLMVSADEAAARCPCLPGLYAWVIRNVRRLAEPVPVRGYLHVFDLAAHEEAAVRKAIP